MTITNELDEKLIKQELVVFLRNADIFSTSVRGVTTVTQEFNGTGSQVDFVMTNLTPQNVRSVSVGGTPSTFGTDYTVDYATKTVTFAVAPGSGTDNVDIQYDYGASDKIFPDWPRVDLKIGSYPRLAVQITSDKTDDLGIGGNSQVTEYLISIGIFANGTANVDTYVKAVRSAILENKKGFYYLQYLRKNGGSAIINEPERAEKIHQKVIDFLAPHNIELIS